MSGSVRLSPHGVSGGGWLGSGKKTTRPRIMGRIPPTIMISLSSKLFSKISFARLLFSV